MNVFLRSLIRALASLVFTYYRTSPNMGVEQALPVACPIVSEVLSCWQVFCRRPDWSLGLTTLTETPNNFVKFQSSHVFTFLCFA
jgi:hypothetical protein